MGITLKAARVNKNLSQVQAADMLHTSVNVVSNWERGITYPNAIQLKDITELYGVKYDDINFLPKNNA